MTCKNCLYFERCQREYFEYNELFKDIKFLYIGDNKSCKDFKDKELVEANLCEVTTEMH